MSGNGKNAAPEEGGGESAPLWIISFADMISLLMAFFVMLSTFNTFDESEEQKLHAAVDTSMMPMGGWLEGESGNALVMASPEAVETEGSDKPTNDQAFPSRPLNQTETRDLEKYKVFDIPSASMFVSQTAVLKPEGKEWLDVLAEFVLRTPGGIVISEQGPDQSIDSSMNRTFSVMSYLKGKGIGSSRLNISCRGTLPAYHYQQQTLLEVCILEQEVK